MTRVIFTALFAFVLASSAAVAVYTAETRYASEQSTIVQRNILQSENRYGQSFVQPFGGFGASGASRGSFGAKGEEEGIANLEADSFIPQEDYPARVSNSAVHARGYRIINTFVKLDPVEISLIERPQITGSPQGAARIVSIRPDQLGLIESTVMLRTKDLPPLAPQWLYEAWLVDEDTGTSMSLGMFQPAGIGRIASLEYEGITPVEVFEKIIVTVEPFPDDDPRPGQVLLSGEIKEKVMRLP